MVYTDVRIVSLLGVILTANDRYTPKAPDHEQNGYTCRIIKNNEDEFGAVW